MGVSIHLNYQRRSKGEIVTSMNYYTVLQYVPCMSSLLGDCFTLTDPSSHTKHSLARHTASNLVSKMQVLNILGCKFLLSLELEL